MEEGRDIKIDEMDAAEPKIQGDVTVVHSDDELSAKHEGSLGHHHHHHHHSHRHSHRSRRRRSKKNNKKSSVNARAVLIIVGVLAVCTLILAHALDLFDVKINRDFTEGSELSADSLRVELVNGKGLLVSDSVVDFLNVDFVAGQNKYVTLSSFTNGGKKYDAQVPVSMNLSVLEGNAVTYKIELATNEMFDDATTVYLGEGECSYSFKHLMTATEYFYRVTAYTTVGVISQVGSFETEDTPRILTIDGLSNVRDIGSWRTDSGKRIKQGLLIRGTEMDGAVESGYHLTNEGLSDMLQVLGIKTDMDLRAETVTSMDALGSRVEHKYYNMVMYEDIFTKDGKNKVKAVFKDLSAPDSYPIYLHCTYGRDRTGTICYLLEALLGVSRGDCLKEYGLSNIHMEYISTVEAGLAEYKGDTLKEQAEAYLLDCGVTKSQIKSIRDIFLGE